MHALNFSSKLNHTETNQRKTKSHISFFYKIIMSTIIIQPTVSGITTEKAAHRNRRASVWRTPSKQAHRGSCHIHITLSRCNSCFCCILLHAITWHRLTSGLLGKYEQGNFGKPLAQQDQQTQWRLWIWCASMWCYAILWAYAIFGLDLQASPVIVDWLWTALCTHC